MLTKPKQSFTLMELLIVIAIIGILAAAVIFGVKTAMDKSRDSRRLEDINNIAKALHSYYLDNGSFPKEADDYSGGTVGKIGEGNKIDAVIKQYMGGSVPRDPLQDNDNATYYYYYDAKHGCSGPAPYTTIAILFIHQLQTQTPSYPPSPCTSLGGEGDSKNNGAYWIILGPTSG